MTKAVPAYLGPYRLLHLVHTGPATQVWQAYDGSKQRTVAVKLLLEKCRKDREHLGNLRQEYRVGREVVHERIVEVYAQGVEGGIPYLVTEWFAAPSLKRRIRVKEDREKIAYLIPKIIEQAAEALACLHQHDWVHRDIKPENLLVTDDGKAKLIDFGLAKRVRRGIARWFSFKSKRQGTPSYMSPEQIRCAALDQRADMYSFGCMIYELITGTPPFTGATLEELFNKHLTAAPPSLEAMDRNVTKEFGQLVKSCLAKDPAARPGSAGAFLKRFRTMCVYKIHPQPPKPPAR